MSVITISRQFGSGGDEIAYQVSQALGYRIFDRHMIREAAKAAGLVTSEAEDETQDEVLDYSEDNHQVRGFLDTLFGSMPVLPYTGIWPDDLTVSYTLEELRQQRIDNLRLVQKAVKSACQLGNMIIVGRGGQVLLKGEPNVFHIRIVAPPDDRCKRIKAQLEQSEQALSEYQAHTGDLRVKQLIAERDAASADYIQSIYHVQWDDPLLYNLVLNTGKIQVDQAVQMIVGLVQSQPVTPMQTP